MKTIELFCGTKSFSKVAGERGHDTLTYDFDGSFEPDVCADILKIESLPDCDVIWASPPCTTFSVASIGRHWNRDKTPKTPQAEIGLQILQRTIDLIEQTKPKIWFLENPRGMMRNVEFMKKYRRTTVTYCQYGDTRMKPTDIWTNCDIELKPPCKNGAPCHVAAPRGSKTGTQGIQGARLRAVVPPQLCNDVIGYCELNLIKE